MIAAGKTASPRNDNMPNWHEPFLEMLPAIRRHARVAFRHLDPEARADLEEEVVANAFVAYRRLVELGKADLAYPAPLASFGVRQVNDGRRVGTKANVNDITSRKCQVHKGVRVKRLDHYDVEDEGWKEVLIEDRHAGPAETAIAKIDIGNWFSQLRPRDRAIASYLALGNGTNEAARAFRVTKARISQKRREFLEGWRQFQGEPIGAGAVA